MLVVMGAYLVGGGFGICWPVMRYSIRADHAGISQTNGFFRQSVRWSDVAAYYVQPNTRYYKERQLHLEPVMLNAQGAIVFHGFAHLLVSTKNIIQQRRELWQFVETQLKGKRIEAPAPTLDLTALAWKSLKVNWSDKTLWWKMARVVGLISYALFWLGLTMIPVYYMVTHNITIAKPWGSFLILPMCIGPFLPHIIWLSIKKRKIAKELEGHERTG